MPFKIRRADGLFSSGGQYPRWSTKGKIWASIGAVKTHLLQLHDKEVAADWQLLEFELVVVERGTQPVRRIYDEVVRKRQEREARQWKDSVANEIKRLEESKIEADKRLRVLKGR